MDYISDYQENKKYFTYVLIFLFLKLVRKSFKKSQKYFYSRKK